MNDDTVPLTLPRPLLRPLLRPLPRRRRRRAGSLGLAVLGVLLIAAAAGLGAHMLIYQDTARADAAALRGELTRMMAAAGHGSTCTAPPPSAPTAPGRPRMLLTIPAIGLTAPVMEGTGDDVLDQGVGHVTSSTWPDQAATDVLAAHNATFFVRLPDLKPGDTITLTAPCRAWTYKVSGQRVVTNTTIVPVTDTPTLDLVTCWPINALFNTANRYLLTAELISQTDRAQAHPTIAAPPAPTWKATLPSALLGADLSDAATGVTTGRLTTAGTPSPAWQSSTASLNAVGPALELLGGTIRAIRTGHPSWWATLAPGVSRSVLAPLLAAPTKVTFRTPLDVTLTVTGDLLNRVDLTTTMQVGTGTYRLEATAVPHGTEMSVAGWQMTLIAGRPPTSAAPVNAASDRTTGASRQASTQTSSTASPSQTSGGTPPWTPAPSPTASRSSSTTSAIASASSAASGIPSPGSSGKPGPSGSLALPTP